MKTSFVLTTILAMVMTASNSTRVDAQVADITSPNGQGFSASGYSAITAPNVNADPRPGLFQLGYVHANCVPDKTWDLEAFGYNGTANALTYVGGFDPLTQNVADGQNWSLGDIFISSSYVAPQTFTITDGSPVDYANGASGYQYAIGFTRPASGTTITYTIYDLSSTAQLETPYFNQNMNSGPYALDLTKGGYTVVGSGAATVFTETGAQINTLLNETGAYGTTALFNTLSDQASADNYVVSVPLNALTSLGLTVFDADLTESCGNDLLQGSGTATNLVVVPEPSSLGYALAGVLFLCGSGLLRRKLQA